MRGTNRIVLTFMAVVLIAGALPIVFDVYRIVVFRAVSYDDYAPYMLWLLDEPGGKVPGSAHGYRIGSVLAAIPFYHLPLVVLNESPLWSREYLQATQAICFAGIFFVGLTAITLAVYAHTRLRTTLEWSFIGALVFLLFARYLALGTLDGIATFPTLLLIIAALERRVALFVVLALVAAVMNEKILLMGAIFVSLRALFLSSHRRDYVVMSLATFVVIVLYAVTIKSISLPGNEHQLDPATYFDSLRYVLAITLGTKGLYQNLWPILLLAGMWLMSMIAGPRQTILAWPDIGVALGLTAMGFIFNADYNLGRIVMYALPLYLLGAVQAGSQLRDQALRARFAVPDAQGPIEPMLR